MSTEAVSGSRGMSGDERLEMILTTAERMFHQKGYRAISIRDLASAVGIKMSSLYYYFPSKEDILYRIVKRHLTGLLDATQETRETLPVDADAAARLAAIIRTGVLTLVIDRDAAGVSLTQTRELAGEQRAELQALTKEYEQLYRRLIAEGIESGVFIDTDPAMASYLVLAALTRVSIWFQPSGRLTAEQVADYYSSLLVRSLLPNPTARALEHMGAHANPNGTSG